MNSIENLIIELGITKKMFIPSMIREINCFVSNKLSNINEIYKNNNNKYYLLTNLVNFGLELENIIKLNDNNILSIQLNFLTWLINPIITKLRNICLELNLELVDEYKNKIYDLIETDLIKYKEHKKNIKFLQVNCFCRNTNYTVGKEILFEDFGITIKITNYHFKDIFREFITDIFIQNNNSKDKRFDWFWKAVNYENNYEYSNEQYYNENSYEINNYEQSYDINNSEINNKEITKSFKIIQKKPDITKQFKIKNENQMLNIIKPTEKEMTKIISNSIIVEDESFSIPIDNNDDLSLISNIEQEEN
jgi:hypothetical protein